MSSIASSIFRGVYFSVDCKFDRPEYGAQERHGISGGCVEMSNGTGSRTEFVRLIKRLGWKWDGAAWTCPNCAARQ